MDQVSELYDFFDDFVCLINFPYRADFASQEGSIEILQLSDDIFVWLQSDRDCFCLPQNGRVYFEVKHINFDLSLGSLFLYVLFSPPFSFLFEPLPRYLYVHPLVLSEHLFFVVDKDIGRILSYELVLHESLELTAPSCSLSLASSEVQGLLLGGQLHSAVVKFNPAGTLIVLGSVDEGVVVA